MTFAEVINSLNIEEYPDYFEELYSEKIPSQFFTREYIISLNERFEIFPKYLDIILKASDEIKTNEALLNYTQLMAAALKCSLFGKAERGKIILPKGEGIAFHFAGLLAMLPAMEESFQLLFSDKIDEKYRNPVISQFEGCISSHEQRFTYPAVNQSYFNWLINYLNLEIFLCGSLNIQIYRKNHGFYYVLKNKSTGENKVLMTKTMHRDGMVLGSADYEDRQGAYTADFKEFEDRFEGYPVLENGFCSNKKESFSKENWYCALKPGEPVINIHIPKKAKLDTEACKAACEEALQLFSKISPDFKPKAAVCYSWLLDPRIDSVIGGSPNIKAFQEQFTIFPMTSDGTEVFQFVFCKNVQNLNDLPEDTRMMRAFKKRYLEGLHILSFGGVIIL